MQMAVVHEQAGVMFPWPGPAVVFQSTATVIHDALPVALDTFLPQRLFLLNMWKETYPQSLVSTEDL